MDVTKYDFSPDFQQFRSRTGAHNQGYIGIERAKKIALNHAGLQVSQVYFTKQKFDFEDGIPVYEIEFIYGRYEYEYEIDAVNGRILGAEREFK